MSEHSQANAHTHPNRSDRGSTKVNLIIVAAAILFIAFVFLMAVNAIKSDPAIHSIFFVVLLVICVASSIVLDLSLFEHKRNQSPEDENKQIRKPAYHPNLRIWAVGMISGIGATIIYLITMVTLSLVKQTAVTQQTLYQYTLLLTVLSIAIAFTIWGIVQVCRE